MLVSSNNDVSLPKAFEELSISSQVNCGFNNKNEKSKTSKPIIEECTDDELDYMRRAYVNMIEYKKKRKMEQKFNQFFVGYFEDDTVPYPKAKIERNSPFLNKTQDSDISSNEDKEESLLSKLYPEHVKGYLEYEASCIDATKTTLDSLENPSSFNHDLEERAIIDIFKAERLYFKLK